ncbi:hypothetical protein GS439_15870 [Rhodococcus hoagii]|nr:hypothetical protein [Prescottella equi]
MAGHGRSARSRNGSGPTSGLRVAVTDLFAIEGQRIGAGNPAWLGQAATETATADSVARLLAGGATVAGIAQTVGFGSGTRESTRRTGRRRTAAASGRVPGGATSGASTAVARRTATVGLGPDTTGVDPDPAAYQGLYGFGPTHGAVSTAGAMPLSRTFDKVGGCAPTRRHSPPSACPPPLRTEIEFDAAVTLAGLLAVADRRSPPRCVPRWRSGSGPVCRRSRGGPRHRRAARLVRRGRRRTDTRRGSSTAAGCPPRPVRSRTRRG